MTKVTHKIRNVNLEVSSQCQNDCKNCAHIGLRQYIPDYQLTLEQLNKFIDVTEKSGYFIKQINIHGPGEPLLWKHFNEGIKLLKKSKSIGNINVTTNGILLDSIPTQVLKLIDLLGISVYKDSEKYNSLFEQYESVYNNISLISKQKFRRLPVSGEYGEIPCRCLCSGPSVLGDKILLYCGPPVFYTDCFKTDGIKSIQDTVIPVREHWYDGYDINKIGNMYVCHNCWANRNLRLERRKHSIRS